MTKPFTFTAPTTAFGNIEREPPRVVVALLYFWSGGEKRADMIKEAGVSRKVGPSIVLDIVFDTNRSAKRLADKFDEALG